MKTCAFFGHSKLELNDFQKSKLRKELCKQIIEMMEKMNVTTFLNGGRGEFDELCGETVHELTWYKREIKSYYVKPYDTKTDKFEKQHLDHIFTSVFLPLGLTNVSKGRAIPERNKMMVEKSDFIISYIKKDFGGAFNAIKYAKNLNENSDKNIMIINLFENLKVA